VNLTVGRRIITGFVVGGVLVVAIALVGIWALGRVSSGFEEALAAERDLLLATVEGRGAFRNSNIAYLRSVVDNTTDNRTEFDAEREEARRIFERLRIDASTGEQEVWAEALRLLGEWESGAQEMMSLWAAGDQEAARQVRAQRIAPVRDQLEAQLVTARQRAQVRTDSTVAMPVRWPTTPAAASSSLALLVFIITALPAEPRRVRPARGHVQRAGDERGGDPGHDDAAGDGRDGIAGGGHADGGHGGPGGADGGAVGGAGAHGGRRRRSAPRRSGGRAGRRWRRRSTAMDEVREQVDASASASCCWRTRRRRSARSSRR
jgi:hypothetical protein